MKTQTYRHRGAVNTKAIAGIVLAVVLISIALYLNVGKSSSSKSDIYFVDLATGKLFVQPGGTLAPVAAPSQSSNASEPTGVFAYVYACGECSGDQFIGYVEKFTDAHRQMLSKGATSAVGLDEPQNINPKEYASVTAQGVLVAAWPESEEETGHTDLEWVVKSGEAGRVLTRSAITDRCGNMQKPRICLP